MDDTCDCPKCGEECARDEVDVGIGILTGPWGCSCGWSDHPWYDRSEGISQAQKANPDYYVDSQGGMTPLAGIQEKLEHFGLPGEEIIDSYFRNTDSQPKSQS